MTNSMAKRNDKFFDDISNAAQQMFDAIGTNHFTFFEANKAFSIPDVPVMPQAVIEKYDGVYVVASGDFPHARNWLCIAGLRRDVDKSLLPVYDLDPILFAIDSNGSPARSGVISYHQDFPGRTLPRTEYVNHRVDALCNSSNITFKRIEEAPPPILSALEHMFNKHKSTFFPNDYI
jgi:hypothetical protein